MKKIYSILLVAAVAAMSTGCAEKKAQELSFTQLMEQSSPEQVQAWYNGASRLDAEYTKAHAAELRAQKKLLVFDLDGTLSNHKCPMPEANSFQGYRAQGKDPFCPQEHRSHREAQQAHGCPA